jgi:membrane fusion protein (multidrug efflux system)
MNDAKSGNGRWKWLWWFGPVVVLAGGIWLYVGSGKSVSTDDAYVHADHVTIAAQVAGRVVEVAVRENQSVHQGDLLFRIDPEPLKIAVARAEAQLAATHDMLVASGDQYHSAAAEVRSADATTRNAELQLARMKEMKERGLVAQKAVDDAQMEVQTARSKRESNQALLAKARNVLGGTLDKSIEDLAPYRMMQAELAKARLDLANAEVRAPMDGVVGKLDLQPGSYLGIGQPALPLVSTTGLWVDANFKETDLTDVVVGQVAEIEVDTYPGRRFKAHVASISPASGAEYSVLPAQNATGNWVKVVQRIPVRLAFDPEDGAPTLRAGMSASVQIDTAAAHRAGVAARTAAR